MRNESGSVCNIEAEQGVLGSMMLNPAALAAGLSLTEAADYYRPAHRSIYNALASLHEKQEPVDLITLQEALRRSGDLEAAGGTEYLMAVVDAVPTAQNVEYYAAIVKEMSVRRRMVAAASQLARLATDTSSGNRDTLAIQATQIAASIDPWRNNGHRSVGDVVNAVYQQLEDIQHGIKPRRIPFGLGSVDRALRGGPSMGDLVVVAAETGHGKTAMLTMLAQRAAFNDIETYICTLEMTAEQYAYRLMCSTRRIDAAAIEAGQIPWTDVTNAANDWVDKRVVIADNNMSISDLELYVERWVRDKQCAGNGLLIVDYAALLRRVGRYNEEVVENGDRIKRLKQLAKQHKIVVATASQFRKEVAGKREAATRVDANSVPSSKIPFGTLDDLHGSSEIKTSADIVLMVYNPPETPPDPNSGKPKAHIYVAKFRHGNAGQKMPCWYTREHTRFDDISMATPPVAPAQPASKQSKSKQETQNGELEF